MCYSVVAGSLLQVRDSFAQPEDPFVKMCAKYADTV